jgi:shikimate dehydrogenase
MMLPKSHLELKALIQAIKTFSIPLTAVTMPFKEKVFELLDDGSEEVMTLKTANTLLYQEGRLHGYNTDLAGIAYAFAGIDLDKKQILVIGAGGVARTLGYFLKKNNASIVWLNRDSKKAEMVAQEFGGNVITSEQVKEMYFDIIINTTPVGLYPDVSASPLPDYLFHKKQIVFDMIYHPFETQLIKQAQNQHARILSGLDMFIGQGIKQIELLTGQSVNDPVFIHALKKILIQHQSRRDL